LNCDMQVMPRAVGHSSLLDELSSRPQLLP
jgi:hypothetical protein